MEYKGAPYGHLEDEKRTRNEGGKKLATILIYGGMMQFVFL